MSFRYRCRLPATFRVDTTSLTMVSVPLIVQAFLNTETFDSASVVYVYGNVGILITLLEPAFLWKTGVWATVAN